MWDTIDQIRNQIAGYEPEVLASDFKSRQREASRIAMLKLYAKRRRLGLNARGLPRGHGGRVSGSGLSVKTLGKFEYHRRWKMWRNKIESLTCKQNEEL